MIRSRRSIKREKSKGLFIKSLPMEIKILRTKNVSMCSSLSMFVPLSQPCSFASSILSSKGFNKTCNQESSVQQQLILGLPPSYFQGLFLCITILNFNKFPFTTLNLEFFPAPVNNLVILDYTWQDLPWLRSVW